MDGMAVKADSQTQRSGDTVRLIAFCTCPPGKGLELARELVRRRLCACVNILPGVRSVYEWKGAIEEDAEELLLIKTRSERFAALELALRELHPYEVFELISAKLEAGSQDYLRWLDAAVGVGVGPPE